MRGKHIACERNIVLSAHLENPCQRRARRGKTIASVTARRFKSRAQLDTHLGAIVRLLFYLSCDSSLARARAARFFPRRLPLYGLSCAPPSSFGSCCALLFLKRTGTHVRALLCVPRGCIEGCRCYILLP